MPAHCFVKIFCKCIFFIFSKLENSKRHITDLMFSQITWNILSSRLIDFYQIKEEETESRMFSSQQTFLITKSIHFSIPVNKIPGIWHINLTN